jgi:hypothetical protein
MELHSLQERASTCYLGQRSRLICGLIGGVAGRTKGVAVLETAK